jgi:hypothetical protein
MEWAAAYSLWGLLPRPLLAIAPHALQDTPGGIAPRAPLPSMGPAARSDWVTRQLLDGAKDLPKAAPRQMAFGQFENR